MINLIPNEDKKKMARDFYYRLMILSFYMLGFAVSLALMAMVPSYIASESKEKILDNKIALQKSEPVPVLDQETLSAIQNLDIKLGLVEKVQADTFVVSKKIINEIIMSRVSGIKITGISYDNDVVLGRKVGINGTAPSRERLLLFRRALESNPAFKNVDLPIANFVKGSDIQFFLSLIPA